MRVRAPTHPTLMISLARALPLLLAPAALSNTVADYRFAPEEGSEVTIEFRQVFQVELVDMTLSFNGEEIDISEMGVPEFQLLDEEELSIRDTFVTVGDDRPAVVHRAFDELTKMSKQSGSSPDGEEHSTEDPGESELEGTTVVFTWDADEEEYVPTFLEEDGDEDLLVDLAFQGYLWDALPDGEVEEGDRWEVGADFFDVLSEPCGDLHFVLESEDGEDEDDDWGEQFSDNLEGEFYVTYAGTRDEDGVTVAVFTLEAEVSTEIVKEEEIDEEIQGESISGTTSSTFSFDFEMEGELLWNIAANRPYHVTFNGDVEFEIDQESEVETPGGELTQTQVQMFEGTVELTTSYE